jgi:NAD(P)H dehydrogenase (quinone)
MTTYAVTGATGHLGALAIEALLARGVPAADLVAIARTPGRATGVEALGVGVREGDYARPDTLRTALKDVDELLLVSGSEVGRRVAQHGAVIEAAKAAGVRRVAYTSITRADSSPIVLAPEHRATEELLRASGLAYTVLRNNWYLENYTDRLAEHLARGVILGATAGGRIAAAARADYADAAAAVLTGPGHDGRVYELAGPPLTLAGLAAAITEVTGTPVSYRDVSTAELVAALGQAGLDPEAAGFVAALDEGIARGDLDIADDTLTRLIGRAPTPLETVLRAAR